jgi:DNA-binding protein HU-beta
VNKAELVNALADRLGGNKKAAGDALEAVIDTIYRSVAKGEKVTITGFGSFEKVQRAARTGRNPATGQSIKVKKSVAPKFRPGQEFKNVISGAKKLPRVAATKSTTASAPARAAAAKKAPAKAVATKTAAKKTAAKKATPAKSTASKSTASKSRAAKTLATKPVAVPGKVARSRAAVTLAKKAPASKAAPARKTATKTTTKRAAAKR